MTTIERALLFDCEGDTLVGVLAQPARPSALGVLIVVGGPQYRAGSHRQFVHLARALAARRYCTLRFDCRGMGDSGGRARTFEEIEEDIAAAAAALRRACPAVQQVVAFGLCDAASALLMAAGRVDLAALMLANPWVRRPDSLNAAVVQHYYAGRLRSVAFWRDLLAGRVPVRARVAELLQRLRRLRADRRCAAPAAAGDFVDSMRGGWQRAMPTLLLISEHDITAREFGDLRRADARWRDTGRVVEAMLHDADHTFSSAAWKDRVVTECTRFLEVLVAETVAGAAQPPVHCTPAFPAAPATHKQEV